LIDNYGVHIIVSHQTFILLKEVFHKMRNSFSLEYIGGQSVEEQPDVS
jgi:hypothetical protein